MPFADTSSGARLYYVDEGAGQPVLLIHGLLGSAEAHFPRLIEWLQADYRVIGPTLRGYGQSLPKPRDFPLRFYHRDAGDVLALMDALAIERAHMLGYSDGGEAALVAAGQQPERFLSVATIGAVGHYTPDMRPQIQNHFPGNWIPQEELDRNGIANADAFILPWVTALKQYIDAGGDISLGTANRISVPLLMMLGEQDRLNPARLAQQVVARAPQGQLKMFPCGHAVHDECWPMFQRVYGDFLKRAG